MLALIAIHAVAALWHHVVLRDGTLGRMLPARRVQPRLGTPSPG
jgi:cytochrome b561